MRAEHRHECDDEKDFAKPLEHADKLNFNRETANHFSEIQTKVPLGSRSNNEIKSASARWMQPCDAGWPMDF